MRRFTLRMMLMVAFMVLGMGSAWADKTLVYGRSFVADETTGVTAWSSADIGTDAWTGSGICTADTNDGLKIASANGTRTWTNTSQIKPTSEYILTYDIDWNVGASYGTGNSGYLKIGNCITFTTSSQDQYGKVTIGENDDISIVNACIKDNNRDGDVWTIHLVVNTKQREVTELTIAGSKGTAKVSYSLTGAMSVGDGANFNSLTIGTVKSGTASSLWTGIKSVVIMQEPAGSTATVTYKYEDTNGNSLSALKEDVQASKAIGSSISTLISSDLTETFYNDDSSIKYVYSTYSVNDDITTLPEAGATITLKFEPRNKYNYSVTTKEGLSNYVLGSGSGYQNEIQTVPYSRYIMSGGSIYECSASNKEYRTTFTLNSNNQEVQISCSSTSDNAILCLEGEDIEGMSNCTGTNVVVRCSGTKAGTTSTPLTIAYLPPGTYTLAAGFYENANTSANFHTETFTVGDNTLSHTMTNANVNVKVFDPFTITERTAVVYNGTTSTNLGLDYVYITGTPEGEIVGALDYSTNYLGMTSDKVTLSPGSSYQFKFKNYNNGGTDNYKNYLVPVYVGDSNPLVIRSDNFEIGDWKNDGCSNNFDWNTNGFVPEMNGATVDMILNYTSDNVLQMLATITTSYNNTWKYFYTSDYAGSKFVSGGSAALTGDIQTALSVEKAFLTILSEKAGATMSLTLSSVGWATLYTPFALDFTGTGLTAYTATVANDQVTLAEVSSVPAYTGVVLKGDEGSYEIPVVASSTETNKGDLQGAPATDRWMSDDTDYYMLAYNSESDKVQFTKLTSGSIAAGKAYLVQAKNSTSGARTLNVVFAEGGTTGIQTLDKTQQADGACYNLNGQRVSQPAKGLYIVNGKKVVIK